MKNASFSKKICFFLNTDFLLPHGEIKSHIFFWSMYVMLLWNLCCCHRECWWYICISKTTSLSDTQSDMNFLSTMGTVSGLQFLFWDFYCKIHSHTSPSHEPAAVPQTSTAPCSMTGPRTLKPTSGQVTSIPHGCNAGFALIQCWTPVDMCPYVRNCWFCCYVTCQISSMHWGHGSGPVSVIPHLRPVGSCHQGFCHLLFPCSRCLTQLWVLQWLCDNFFLLLCFSAHISMT